MMKATQYALTVNLITGVMGLCPKKTISSIEIIMGKDTVTIPPAAYADLYNLNFAYAG